MTALWRNYLTAAALHGCLLLVVLSASTCFGATLTRAPLFYPGGQFRLGNSAWGDYDNDGFPDLMASGWVLHNESGTSFSLASTAISGESVLSSTHFVILIRRFMSPSSNALVSAILALGS